MSTRRGWQAMVGELAAVLRHLNVAQGADPHSARRACPPLGSDLCRCSHTRHSPCDSLYHAALAQ
jgi:hypothetical protein